MIVQVDQTHIDRGFRRRALCCPVAIALQEATGQDWWVGDGDEGGTVLDPCIGEEVEAPREVHRFRYRFDFGKPVKPFQFEIPDDCKVEVD